MNVRAALVGLGTAALLTAAVGPTARAGPAPVRIEVDPGTDLGPLNHDLIGFGWHHGGAPLAAIEDLAPRMIRLDASMQDVSTAPGAPLHLAPLLSKVAEIRAIGADPLVILSYMPEWLGAPNAHGRDPTRVKPADLDAWQRLVHDVVHELATAAAPARHFEAWNEPDIPLFWQDTPIAWIDTVERTARAIADVETETGIDLQFAGPATAVPDPAYLLPFLARFRDPGLPLDTVTWHYYGNYPFFGPDGAEFPITAPVQPVLGQQNPLASPAAYGGQVNLVRAWVDAGLAGSGRPTPALAIDEWNLSAAGYDHRHDTHEGAAFAAGVLAEMQASGLDQAAFFRANDTAGVAGEHGAVTTSGSRKPVWWAFWLWQQMASQHVPASGGSQLDGLWATAARDVDRVTVLLSSFSAAAPRDRTIEIAVAGSWTSASVRRVGADHSAADAAEVVPVESGVVHIELPAQAVALVELRGPTSQGESLSSTNQTAGRSLPATGGTSWPVPPAALLAMAIMGGVVMRRTVLVP